MRRRHFEFSSDLDMNLIPLVDITMMMIFFFMVNTQFSSQEMDTSVTLPHVDNYTQDASADPGRLVLNINDQGVIQCFGHVVKDNRELRTRLKVDADLARDAPGKPSNRTVLIRADRATQFRRIEDILYYCSDPQIRIWKLSFGTTGEAAPARAAPRGK